MSDTVDQVLDSVTSAETSEVVVEETPPEVAEEESPVEEEASVEETPVEEVAPVEEAPVTTQEVVQNVQAILTTPSNEDLTDKERLVQLEKRVDDLVTILRSIYRTAELDDELTEYVDLKYIKDKLNNV
tara:strand:- start:91 stop:477 length:387 start_codon:yes stop_codon:yes gene_type:complete